MGLYRLCLGHTADNKQGRGFLLPILSSLLTFLGDAIIFRPQQSSEVSGCLDRNSGGGGGGGGGGCIMLQEACAVQLQFSQMACSGSGVALWLECWTMIKWSQV